MLSLDVFRGLTVAGMLLVNDPGNWGAIYPPLEHAEWNGWTPTDVIFPFFLFIAGVTTHLSLSARRAAGADDRALARQILKRGALIVPFGWLMAVFPFNSWDRFTHIRIPGVLQRIGVRYTIAALISMRTTLKQQVAIVAAILLGYWFMITLVPVPGAMGGIGAKLNTIPRARSRRGPTASCSAATCGSTPSRGIPRVRSRRFQRSAPPCSAISRAGGSPRNVRSTSA